MMVDLERGYNLKELPWSKNSIKSFIQGGLYDFSWS
jgi:hypothetical protein